MGDNLPPVGLGAGRTALGVTLGDDHTCALPDDATVKCWGRNDAGQLGQGDTDNRESAAPIDLGAGRTAVAVTAGGNHTCARLDNEQIRCWGLNDDGQLGLGDTGARGDQPNELGDNLAAVYLRPVNDQFADAETLTGATGTRAGTNANASVEFLEPFHGDIVDATTSVWWSWTPTVGGHTYVHTLGSTFNTVLAVYTGNGVDSLVPIASNNDIGTSVQSALTFQAQAGTTYRIAVAGFGAGGSGRVALTWQQSAPCDGRPVTLDLSFGGAPTAGNDVIRGTAAANTIDGGGGNDRICGGGGTDTLIGGAGNDRLLGEAGVDTLNGGIGNDVLIGGNHADRLNGQSGNDTLNGGVGADNLQGGAGKDRLNGGTQRDTCNGGPQRDTQTGCEVRRSIP
jgi:Ca2+-binding RTX toxin-like protein